MCSCDADEAIEIDGRSLYYVIFVENRREVVQFFKNILGMTILRNDEIAKECDEVCKESAMPVWSKTMIGYRRESDNFCFQLAYNYGTDIFKKGNALMSITIANKEILERAKESNITVGNGNVIYGPETLKFIIKTTRQSPEDAVIEKLLLASSNLTKTIEFWLETLGLKAYSRTHNSITLGFHSDETKIEFVEIGKAVSHGTNCGVVAYACPSDQLSEIWEKILHKYPNSVVPREFVQPRTTVRVPALILRDPDGHQVCFYDNDEYRKVFLPTIGVSRSLENQLILEEAGLCAPFCRCDMLHESCKNRRAKMRTEAGASAGIGGGNQEEKGKGKRRGG